MGQITTINFRGAELYGFQTDEGAVVALKPIVDNIGLAWNGQLERVKRDPILSKGMRMTRIPFGSGGAQECVCLRLDLINGWLFTIDSNRVKDEQVRGRVIAYQEECYGVLASHFIGRRPAPQSVPVDEGEPIATLPTDSRRLLVNTCNTVFGPVAARQLWFKLGLETVPAMYAEDVRDNLFTYTAVNRDIVPMEEGDR